MKFFIATIFLWYTAYQGSVECKIDIISSDVVGSFGLPEKALSDDVSQLPPLYTSSNMDEVFLQLHTPCNTISFPITKAEEILESPEFDVNKKVVIFVNDGMLNAEMNYIGDMAKAYNCRGGHNFLALDTTNFLSTAYTCSSFHTEELGRVLAQALEKLTEQVPVKNIHLIGHSWGGHVAGYAGHRLGLARITVLDPAERCYFPEDAFSTGPEGGDDATIYAIIKNPDDLGQSNSIGDVESLNPLNAGCSHCSAYTYYTESVYPDHETNFVGIRCSSLAALKDGSCNGEQFPMGYALPYNLEGNYFLVVNPKSPYAEEGTLSSSECGKCTN